MSSESILVYAPSWIGDAVMSLGAIRALRKARPGARIVVLTRPWVAELYDSVKEVDSRLSYDPRGVDRGLRGLVSAARRIREERFDLALVLPNAFRAAAFVRLGAVRERWGYATESRGFLLTHTVPPAPRPFGRHQSFYYLELLSALGIPASEPELRLSPTRSMSERARDLLTSEGWDGKSLLVGVHPGATNSRAKLWGASRYAEVARKLAAASDARVVVLGGPKESELASGVGEAVEAPILLHGKTSLGELMGVLAELSVFLTNDSGPMHLAASLDVPTVAIFGPTDPRETGPFSARARVVRERVDCSPCLYRDCPIDHRCMENVSVERVFEEASGLLGAKLAPAEATSH